jgi:hypothetical protein
MQINAQAVFSVRWLAVMSTMECLIPLSPESRCLNFMIRVKKFPIPAHSALRLGAFKLAQ